MSFLTKIGPLFRQGMNEIPEVMSALIIGVGIFFPLTIYKVYRFHQEDGNNKRYKYYYHVLRHDDPRVARIKQ